ncbi:Ig-like domain-containing protein [Clostridium beijerinckii]|uniref:BIG2 domain-containing protein n=1 Tax=Clostridium beijerinckii TaxID=1520 RepID=A0A1S9NA14_CLOBE|nr:Ig-like domain-containing protein [Clostridium beijerinckii]OOP74153.1 hypothetical protein CBEIBR21_06545 [Clostridium beijerinckii]
MNNPIDIMYKQLVRLRGAIGKINDLECRFLITEETDNDENKYDLKSIITDQSLKQGDYVTFNNILYMVFDVQKPTDSIYTKGTMREVLKITFETSQNDVYAVVDKVKGVYADGQEITEVHDEYRFIVPKNSCNYTSISVQNNLIVYSGGSYDAISIDDSKEGILIITGRFNSVYNPHTYAIKLSETTKTLVETENYTIVVDTTDNGTKVSNPQLKFVSNDTSVATVDSNKGIVSAVKSGSCTITCTYNNVSEKLALIVVAKPVTPVISYTENWSQTTTIKQYVTSTYTVTRNTDGIIETPLIDYTFDSDGESLISNKKIVVAPKADNSFSVKNSTITNTTTCYVTIKDSLSGHVIVNQLLTFVKGV